MSCVEVLAFIGLDVVTLAKRALGTCVAVTVVSDWVVASATMSCVEVLAFTGFDVVTLELGSPAAGVVVILVSDWVVASAPIHGGVG